MRYYKEYLRKVNLYIINEYFVNDYISYQIKNEINQNIHLKDIQKKYLIFKIDRVREKIILEICTGYFNLFKLSKNMVGYESIYQLIHFCRNTKQKDKKNKNIRRIEHCINSSYRLKEDVEKIQQLICDKNNNGIV